MTDKIKEKMEELPQIIENVPSVVFRLSHKEDNWKTWFVTQNISMYGYTVDEFIEGGRNWFDIVHPDDRVMVAKTIRDYESHHVDAFKLYYRLVKKNGDSVPVTEYNTVNRDRDGNIVCYDTVIANNTQTEANRRLIDDHYRQQVVLNDILMSLHDSDLDHALQIILDRTGAYLDTSRALLFKDSPDHKTCKIVYEWCNRDIESVMALDYSITYATGMPEIYIALQTTGSLLIDYGEIPENCKEEFEAEGLVASAIFAIYLEGDHYGFVCFDDCVVERKWDEDTVRFLKNISNVISTVLARQNAAEKLEQNRKTYEAVLDNVDSYIFVTNPDTEEIIFANRSFKDTFDGDCIGRRASAYVDIAAASPKKDAQADGGDERSTDYPEFFCEQSGEWLALSSEEITWVDGKPVNLFNCYDITAKKLFADTLEQRIDERTRELRAMTEEAERAQKRAEEAARAKSQFLANMSHEIRTPMNAIIGMTNIYQSSDDPERKDYCVGKIEEASVHLLGIINDILDMSKIEAGKLDLSFAAFRFENLLMKVTNVLNYSLHQKDQEFNVEIDSNIPPCMISDEQRISQVITNLLSNAVKFTPRKGSIFLTAKLLENLGDRCTVSVTVRDTGIGIEEAQKERLFRSFEQADAGISRKYGGTGLGLAISKNIAILLNGDIVLESTPGEGATFTFTFEAKPCGESLGETVPVDLSDVRVLVADDASDVRECFQHFAETHGFSCETTADGYEANERIQASATPYDIVFVDWQMPGMDGIELAKKIRAYCDTICIMISAYDWSEIEQEARDAGIERFIAKPLFPSDIVGCMRQALGRGEEDRTEEPAERAAESFASYRILLAEDVELNREILISLLEPTDIGIDCAEDGAEAVRMFEENRGKYDAIFMDIHMPGVDGYEATRQIRALEQGEGVADADRIPIIAMTANVFREDIERCFACGMDDHIGKPLSIDDVIDKLKKHLRRKK